MTNQTIFNKVAKHLLTQKAKALDPETGKCLYRAPDGKRCAVGCLISEAKYAIHGKNIEGFTVDVINSRCGMRWSEHAVDLLRSLQEVHDLNSPRDWKDRLRKLATDYYLEFPEDL